MGRARTAFAAAAGAALFAWWAATGLGWLTDGMLPRQRNASHVAAELLLAVMLLLGAWLERRGHRQGRAVLAAALGALFYACVNVVDDYAGQAAMLAVLVVAAGASLMGLGSMLGTPGSEKAGPR